jgi:hypothetical protein
MTESGDTMMCEQSHAGALVTNVQRAGAAGFDFSQIEAERWLWLRRGGHEIVCNFVDHEERVPRTARDLVLGTHPEAPLEADGETVLLSALAAAAPR